MNRSSSAANAAPFFIVLLIAVVVLGFAVLRAWRSHRRAPGKLRHAARELWAKTGLHWSRPAYLTVHAIIGLAITIGAVMLFSGLADWITDQAAITKFDVQFDNDLHNLATPVGIAIAKVF